MANNSLGIIQSRGLGDIIIAIPIAHYYHKQGRKIIWPVCEEFWPSVKDHVTWVQWVPIPMDSKGDFFYTEPMKRLKNFGCTDTICLYQSLNVVPELSKVPWFQIQHFDEFKYTKAAVPFLNKWTLNECITRNLEKEEELYRRLVETPDYYVTHLEGSNFKCAPDLSSVPAEWQRINITSGITSSVFDWLTIIEKCQALICVDSVISNMVDQLKIDSIDKYWIPRSHIHLTPVLGTEWTMLEPPEGSGAAQKIFTAVP